MGLMKSSETRSVRKPVILLSHYLDEMFQDLFSHLGFETIWARDLKTLERLASEKEIDIALEWQHGEYDFPVRDMLKRIGKEVPLFMCRNWRRGIWMDPQKLRSYGYIAALDVPFRPEDFHSFTGGTSG